MTFPGVPILIAENLGRRQDLGICTKVCPEIRTNLGRSPPKKNPGRANWACHRDVTNTRSPWPTLVAPGKHGADKGSWQEIRVGEEIWTCLGNKRRAPEKIGPIPASPLRNCTSILEESGHPFVLVQRDVLHLLWKDAISLVWWGLHSNYYWKTLKFVLLRKMSD